MPTPFDPSNILRPSSFSPYPYQEAAVKAIVRKFREGEESTLAILPTGCGKTNLMGWTSRWAISKGKRVLTIAHTRELVHQNAASHEELGVPTRIEMAEMDAREDTSWMTSVFSEDPCPGEPVHVSASRDTMQGRRLESWPPDYFGHINIDEGHHGVCDGYTKIFRHFSGATRLFVTATADRLDGQCLGTVARSIAYEYAARDAVRDGWLCRPKFVRCKTEIDLRKFTKRKMKDFSESDIAEAIKPHVQVLANAIRNEIEDRPTIVFCPDILTSEKMADALASLRADEATGRLLKAESVHGLSKNRDTLISAFKAGEFQVLCNANLLTEGFNLPSVAAVVMLRPTMSRALGCQMIGRGMRRGKEDVKIIDFTWVTGGESGVPDPDKMLFNPVEFFDTYTSPSEVQLRAKKILDEGETDDVLEAVERAQEQHEEEVRVRIKVREQKVRYERIVYDPFAVMETLGVPIRQEAPATERVLATPKQADLLKRFGVEGAEHMSRRRAKVLLDEIFKRMDEKKATFKQVAHLVKNGVAPSEARNMSKDEASAYLDTLFGKKKEKACPTPV